MKEDLIGILKALKFTIKEIIPYVILVSPIVIEISKNEMKGW